MRVLHLDIETSPNTAHVWGLFKQTVSLKQLQESSRVMCWAAKWHKDKKVYFASEHDTEHEVMIAEIWEMLEEADVVVHYNGSRFDIPTLNKEFLRYGLEPPSPYKQVDLLKVAKQRFRFPSNKLDYVAQQLGVGKKHPHEGHELWVKCMAGDPKAWKKMKTYNMQDVRLLEKVYVKMLPWIKGHPNAGLYTESDRPVCTNCGSAKIHKKGLSYTNVGIYQRYKCNSCGTPLRGRTQSSPKESRANILTQDKS